MHVCHYIHNARDHGIGFAIVNQCDYDSPWAKTIKKNTNSTQNKYQTHRAKQYEVTSFLSTDCELSTETCSKNVYSLGPMSLSVKDWGKE